MSAVALLDRTSPAVDVSAFEAITAGLVPHSFPTLDDVRSVADLVQLHAGAHTGAVDGGSHLAYLRVSPGTVGIRLRKTNGLDIGDAFDTIDQLHPALGAMSQRGVEQGRLWADEVERPVRGDITEWSRGSRRRMVKRIAELDLGTWHEDGGNLAMCTVTLSRWWWVVAPDAETFKRLLLDVFRQRWVAETGMPWRVVWKLEFQERGAPHVHFLTRVPAMVHPRSRCGQCLGLAAWMVREDRLRRSLARRTERLLQLRATGARRGLAASQAAHDRAVSRLAGHLARRPEAACASETFEAWFARSWADICLESLEADDYKLYLEFGEYERHLRKGTDVSWSGVKFSDPRRTSIYFLKHSAPGLAGSKEYQHVVPQRWLDAGGPGRFWGVSGLDSGAVEVEVAWTAMHRLRRLLRGVARGRAAQTAISRLRAAGDDAGIRSLPRQRARSLTTAGGWVLVNDGLALALALRRAL